MSPVLWKIILLLICGGWAYAIVHLFFRNIDKNYPSCFQFSGVLRFYDEYPD